MSTRKRKRVDDEGAGQKQTFKDLTAEDKSTLMKLAKEGKSTAEIAASLNLSPGSVRGWKHRQGKSHYEFLLACRLISCFYSEEWCSSATL